MKNCMGECSLKVTCPDGECSKILVSSPATCNSEAGESTQSQLFSVVDKDNYNN